MAAVRVASFDEIPDGGLIAIEVDGRPICVARIGEEVFAFEDKCSHRDFPLSNGEIEPDNCSVTCEWHGAEFDIRTGEALCLPATKPIPVFASRIDNGDILVELGND